VIKYRFNKIIKSILINCHLHDEIENSNNRILHYESGVTVSTLRISLRQYNNKFCLLLDFSAACSMKYSFREKKLIFAKKICRDEL